MQDKKEKIVFLDFCGTCVPFQSADKFVYFTISHYANSVVRFRSLILTVLNKLHLVRRLERWTHRKVTSKSLILNQIKGLDERVVKEAAKRYYDEIIKPSLIPETMLEIEKRKSEGYRIVIVSGGYDVYLRYFMDFIGGSQDDVLSTPLLFKNGVFTGKMGRDCMSENKITYVNEHLNTDSIYSIVYSDSLTDAPLMQLADEAYLVTWMPKELHHKTVSAMYYYE